MWRKYCCEPAQNCGLAPNKLLLVKKKTLPLGSAWYLNKGIPLAIHGGQDKFLKVFGNRYQIIIDHDILGVDGINVVHIDDVGFMCPVKFIFGQFFQIVLQRRAHQELFICRIDFQINVVCLNELDITKLYTIIQMLLFE